MVKRRRTEGGKKRIMDRTLVLRGLEGSCVARDSIKITAMFASRFSMLSKNLRGGRSGASALGFALRAQQQQQLRFLSDETKRAIDEAVHSAPVVLFMKGTPEAPACGFSRATIQLLGQQGVDPAKFAAYNVLEDPELRQGIKEYSEWPTIPQLYVNDEFVGGCDIITNMSQTGELAELLDSAHALIPLEHDK